MYYKKALQFVIEVLEKILKSLEKVLDLLIYIC